MLHDMVCLEWSCHGPNAVDEGLNVSYLTCRLSASPAEQLLDNDTSSDVVSSPATSIFVMRDNPRQFFVRQPLPSTASAQTSSPAPSKEPEEAPAEPKARSGTANQSAGQCSSSPLSLGGSQRLLLCAGMQAVMTRSRSRSNANRRRKLTWSAKAAKVIHCLQTKVQQTMATRPADLVKSQRQMVQLRVQAGSLRSHRK